MKNVVKKVVSGILLSSMLMTSCCAQYFTVRADGNEGDAAGSVTARTADSNLLTRVDNKDVIAEDLGIPGQSRYGTSYYAKNIWDMAVKDGKVLLSMGDYGSNTGRVPIYYYTNDSKEKKECSYNGFSGGLSSEEIKRFMEIDGQIYSTATDPLGSGHGSYYKYDSAKDEWTDYYTLQSAVHVYDMVEYDGKIFFGGMYSIKPGHEQIYCCVNSLDKKDFCTGKSSQVVKFYYKDGTEMKSIEYVSPYDGKTYYDFDYWRCYNLFVYKNELYAIHTSNPSYSCTTTSGLFKYDKEKNGFYMIYDGRETKNIVSAHRNYTHFTYSGGKKVPFYFSFDDNSEIYAELKYGQEAVYSEPVLTAKFETDKYFVVVCNGIFKCPDMMSCEPVSLGKGYENYVVRDAFEQDGKYYFLASVKNGTDDFTTAVFETDGNFEKFRKVVSFPTKSFARSFAYNDGYLYFGLGSNGTIDGIGSSQVSIYSGTVLRINLAYYASNDSGVTTQTPTTTQAATTQKPAETTQAPTTTQAAATQKPAGTTQTPTTQKPADTTQAPTTQAPEESAQETETTEEKFLTIDFPGVEDADVTVSQQPLLVKTTAGNKKIILSWNKNKKADGYQVYYSTDKNSKHFKLLTDTLSSKITHKKLSKNKTYTYCVVAYKQILGKKIPFQKSKYIYCVEKNSKYTNTKKVVVDKTSYRLKQGKTARIKAVLIRNNKKKKMMPQQTKPYYVTSDEKVAIVDKKGKITAIDTGECQIYVIAGNGVYKKMRVKVY